MRARARIGTSGYQYRHWRGAFYPRKLAQSSWFDYYAERFDTVEINNTFYGLPDESTFDVWKQRAPTGFCYALKFSRYGSHLKRLKEPQEPITLFTDRARRLAGTLGPILVQLPPNWNVDLDRLAGFLAATGRKHRWALEFRNTSWLRDDVYRLLEAHNAALCIHDMLPKHPRVVTADWVYWRFHGNHYRGSYSHQALTAHAKRIRNHLSADRDVYVYFNNDADGNAPANAATLRRYLSRDRE